jgi:hypothetical protein
LVGRYGYEGNGGFGVLGLKRRILRVMRLRLVEWLLEYWV